MSADAITRFVHSPEGCCHPNPRNAEMTTTSPRGIGSRTMGPTRHASRPQNLRPNPVLEINLLASA
jgi:hypothetical protein